MGEKGQTCFYDMTMTSFRVPIMFSMGRGCKVRYANRAKIGCECYRIVYIDGNKRFCAFLSVGYEKLIVSVVMVEEY